MLLWFVGGAVVIVWQVFRSPGFDYRLVALGAVLPLVEAPFGPAVLHTLAGAVAVLVAVMAATRHRRLVRRRWLGVPIGLFLHLVLDGVWTRADTFWWPALGWDFGPSGLPELGRPLVVGLALEVAGAALLWWMWGVFGLDDPARRRDLVRSGRLTERV